MQCDAHDRYGIFAMQGYALKVPGQQVSSLRSDVQVKKRITSGRAYSRGANTMANTLLCIRPLPEPQCLPPPLVFLSSAILTKSKMQVTCVLLFLSCFFNAITCLDVLPASWNPSGQNSMPRERSLYDIAAERRALIKWDQVSKD